MRCDDAQGQVEQSCTLDSVPLYSVRRTLTSIEDVCAQRDRWPEYVDTTSCGVTNEQSLGRRTAWYEVDQGGIGSNRSGYSLSSNHFGYWDRWPYNSFEAWRLELLSYCAVQRGLIELSLR